MIGAFNRTFIKYMGSCQISNNQSNKLVHVSKWTGRMFQEYFHCHDCKGLKCIHIQSFIQAWEGYNKQSFIPSFLIHSLYISMQCDLIDSPYFIISPCLSNAKHSSSRGEYCHSMGNQTICQCILLTLSKMQCTLMCPTLLSYPV